MEGRTESLAGREMTVSQFTLALRRLIGESPLRAVSVRGEISGWRVYNSGHAYFSVKDSGAQLQCVMFASALSRCAARDSLRDGVEGVFSGDVEIYPPHGKYQLVVHRIAPAGQGGLAAKFEALKAKLAGEGLFDAARKKPIPFLPRVVGVVTSPSGAVIHDMATVMRRRFPNIEIVLYPVKVQGEGAAEEIARGIRWFNSEGCARRPDVIIAGRGGGSIEDLWAFNEETAVRAVAESGIPVISAVGHETDFTLCDFAADVRAGTPSIAAEICVPLKTELERKKASLELRLCAALRHPAETGMQRLDNCLFRLASGARRLLSERESALRNLADRLPALLRAPLSAAKAAVDAAPPRMRASLLAGCSGPQARLPELCGRLESGLRNSLAAKNRALSEASGKLSVLGPESSFRRGWSVTTDSAGKLVRAEDARPGMEIVTRLAGGTIRSKVESSRTAQSSAG